MKPLLVGELNPYGPAEEFALYPSPPNSAGGRLCRLVMRLDEDAYLARYDRVNLCTRRWSISKARKKASEILDARMWVTSSQGGTIVMLGAKVCRAFGFLYRPFTHEGSNFTKWSVVILPHTSGRSRAWNDPGAFDLARSVLKAQGVL